MKQLFTICILLGTIVSCTPDESDICECTVTRETFMKTDAGWQLINTRVDQKDPDLCNPFSDDAINGTQRVVITEALNCD